MGPISPPIRISPIRKGIDKFCSRILKRCYARIFGNFSTGIFSRLQYFGTIDKGDRIEIDTYCIFAICNRRRIARHIHPISFNYSLFIN